MKVEQHLAQKLNLTTALIQSINMLEYSSQEFEQFLQMEEAENPFIEIEWTSKEKWGSDRPTDGMNWNELPLTQGNLVTLETIILQQLRWIHYSPEQFERIRISDYQCRRNK
ncbi:hypothetical protein [Bacillus sp. NSP9.1]|uniref:hypothetical protein n=1 Tax=Bacillus sp. NSP9.1 TaxID=1071078 RepID=UPI0003FAED27|nr:hypothetical protein [Bacillus sp. NSP9.1]QHZ47130.1 hypothetical protein M654_012925 [Bacillus sp. NSP9.1]